VIQYLADSSEHMAPHNFAKVIAVCAIAGLIIFLMIFGKPGKM
jgi:hypothetical protein